MTRIGTETLQQTVAGAAQILALRRLDPARVPRPVLFVFSTREEVGLQGARAVAQPGRRGGGEHACQRVVQPGMLGVGGQGALELRDRAAERTRLDVGEDDLVAGALVFEMDDPLPAPVHLHEVAAAPAADVSVAVARVSGDTDITVTSAATLTFTSGTRGERQTVARIPRRRAA